MSSLATRTKTPLRLALTLGTLALALPAPADAAAQQTDQRPAAGQSERRLQGRPPEALDRELADTLEQLMIVRLKRALELTPEQEEAVAPLLHELVRDRRQNQQVRMEGMRTLAALARDSAAPDDLLRERLDAFYSDQAAARQAELDLLTSIRARLTPRQEARLLAFEERFRSEIRNRMQDARRQREGARPRVDRPQSPRP